MKLAQIRPPKGEPGDPGGLQVSSKSSRGKTSSSSAQKQNLPIAACVDSVAATQWYECSGCDTFIPASTAERECMFCCPVRIKKCSNSEVEKHDSVDREDYYFDCQEPSREVEECVCMHESALLPSSHSHALVCDRGSNHGSPFRTPSLRTYEG